MFVFGSHHHLQTTGWDWESKVYEKDKSETTDHTKQSSVIYRSLWHLNDKHSVRHINMPVYLTHHVHPNTPLAIF